MSTVVITALVLTLVLLMWPRIAQARYWRAVVTPLASIIGSGFLVLGPILSTSFGLYAPLAMIVLCGVAYAFGSAIRFNIHQIDKQQDELNREQILELFASWILAFAYIISVAYYLNLFGAFGVTLTIFNEPFHAKLLTSAVLILILFVGFTRGFSAMEKMEQISVSVKLAIIVGLLAGLIIHFSNQVASSNLVFPNPTITGWSALTLGFGLIVTVQGFETSRYLGATYDATMRISSMKLAQFISTIIYLIYVVLLTYTFDTKNLNLSETAIIDMMALVAPILPILLVVAALSAQFSAAVADTSGAGGLLNELSRGKISARQAYALLVSSGLVITWTVNLFEIIAYASRAFALYYALQAMIAVSKAVHAQHSMLKILFYSLLAILGLCIAAFGTSIE